MGFTARQQHCLEAMGIVPWVAKNSSVVAPVIDAGPAQLIRSDAQVPVESSELELWLSGRSLQLSGSEDAPLLVIVEPAVEQAAIPTSRLPGRTPFSSESTQLFELMMRAINIKPAERRFAVLTPPDSGESGVNAAVPGVDLHGAVLPSTKALLFLVNDWDRLESLEKMEDHHFRLQQSSLPAWRIPHPDVLLQKNQLKRQAWHCLQALQMML